MLRSEKNTIYVAIGLLLLFAIYVYATPYLTLNSMKKDFIKGDTEAILEHVSTSDLRFNIRSQFIAYSNDYSKRNHPQARPGETLGELLKRVQPYIYIGTMIEKSVNNATIDKILTRASEKYRNHPDSGNYITATKYKGLNHFRVAVYRYDTKQTIYIDLKRDGLLGWKVHNVTIPKSTLEAAHQLIINRKPQDVLEIITSYAGKNMQNKPDISN